MPAPNLAEKAGFLPLAGLLGALVGYVELTNADVRAPALLLLAAAFLLGELQPRWVWVWGVLLGLSLPAAHLAGWLRGYPPPLAGDVLPLVVMPVIFAFLAALGGALLRWFLEAVWRPGDQVEVQ